MSDHVYDDGGEMVESVGFQYPDDEPARTHDEGPALEAFMLGYMNMMSGHSDSLGTRAVAFAVILGICESQADACRKHGIAPGVLSKAVSIMRKRLSANHDMLQSLARQRVK
jgi:hypothetical protein